MYISYVHFINFYLFYYIYLIKLEDHFITTMYESNQLLNKKLIDLSYQLDDITKNMKNLINDQSEYEMLSLLMDELIDDIQLLKKEQKNKY